MEKGEGKEEKREEKKSEGKEEKKEEKKEKWELLCCPITWEPFVEPVFLVDDGYTYEKSKIIQYIQENKNGRSPMSIPLTVRKIISNLSVSTYNQDGKLLCPITQEPIQNPVFVEENGLTYEYTSIRKYLQESWGRYKPINLEGADTNFWYIHLHNNRVFQFDGGKKYDPVYFPDRFPYDQFNMSPIPSEGDEKRVLRNLIGEAHEKLEMNRTYENWRLGNCYFNGGCFKQMKFINCFFENCIFRNTCMCSNFISCRFKKCVFLHIACRTDFQCPQTQFSECEFIDLRMDDPLVIMSIRQIKNINTLKSLLLNKGALCLETSKFLSS